MLQHTARNHVEGVCDHPYLDLEAVVAEEGLANWGFRLELYGVLLLLRPLRLFLFLVELLIRFKRGHSL